MRFRALTIILALMIGLPGAAAGQVAVFGGFDNPALITSGDALRNMQSDLNRRLGGSAQGRQIGLGLVITTIDEFELATRPQGRVLTPLKRVITPLPRVLRPLEGDVLRPLQSPTTPFNGGIR